MNNEVALAKQETENQKEIHEGLALVENFEIRSEEDQSFAAEILREIKVKHEEVEKKRTSITKPLNQALREVNNLFRPLKQALEKSEKLLKYKIAEYQQEQEKENARRLIEAAQSDSPEEAQEALSSIQSTTSPKGVNVRYKWKAKIVDESKIPRKYLVPDVSLIEADAPNKIPGVEFVKMPIVTARKS